MKGLTSFTAEERLAKYGPNEVQPRQGRWRVPWLPIFINQFRSPLVYILALAGIFTLFLGKLTDTTAIFLAVALNAFLGFYQEHKTQRALQALHRLVAPRAKVIRDGRQKLVAAINLVPGDIVLLDTGDTVPADGRLIKASSLSLNEALLTGESFPVNKDKKETVFMGTMVASGLGVMRVEKTGMKTRMGVIGEKAEEIGEEPTPLQRQIAALAKVLAVMVGGVAAAIFTIGLLAGYPGEEMFTTSVALAVAAIPEGLPITMTVILTLGMQRILRQKALVRRLLSAETLGTVGVICLDKTGTLTEGKLAVALTDFTNRNWGLRALVLANNRRDPLEIALWNWAEGKLSPGGLKALLAKFPRLREIPFSWQKKLAVSFHKDPFRKNLVLVFVMGAPEIVISKCQMANGKFKIWEKKLRQYGGRGYRLVGLAYKNMPISKSSNIQIPDLRGMNWLGVVAFSDPLRPEVGKLIQTCQRAGIAVKIITGDYPETARAVLESLPLKINDSRVLTGEELEKMAHPELSRRIKEVILFARVTPEQKLRLVKTLKEKGEVVAVMGDGVNDAPALAAGNISIVVDEAADVAKETADIVLLDSNFATIVAAIKEGRVIFENMRKVILYLLSDSFAEVALIGASIILGLPLPVTAVQILWVNLIEDSLPAMALGLEKEEKEIMLVPPRPGKTLILDTRLQFLVFLIGAVTSGILLVFLISLYFFPFSQTYLRTMMFMALGTSSLLMVFPCRYLKTSVFQYHPFSNRYLLLAVVSGLAMLAMAIYLPFFQKLLGTQPLGPTEWLFLLVIGFFDLLAIETLKFFIVRK